jgi:hypothetical protein
LANTKTQHREKTQWASSGLTNNAPYKPAPATAGVLILQSSHNLSDERTEYLIRDRLSFMRFLGLGLADTVPDANTIWGFREALTRARIVGRPAIEVVFERFDAVLATAGFLAPGFYWGAARSSTPRSSRRQSSATLTLRSATSRKAAFRRNGRQSPPSCARRTATPAGRSNTLRPNRAPRARRGLISRSQPLVTKITSALIAGIA